MDADFFGPSPTPKRTTRKTASDKVTYVLYGMGAIAIVLLVACGLALLWIGKPKFEPDGLTGQWQRLGQGYESSTLEFTDNRKAIKREGSEVWWKTHYEWVDDETIKVIEPPHSPEYWTVSLKNDNLSLTHPSGAVWDFRRK